MKNKGFTLIELLVVVIAISIMAGIAIPAYQKTISDAQKKETKSTLQSIYTAEKIYHMDNRTYSDSLVTLDIKRSYNSQKTYTFALTSNPNRFTAKATKISDNTWISIDETGIITEGQGKTTPVTRGLAN